jgi:hypothetical protein
MAKGVGHRVETALDLLRKQQQLHPLPESRSTAPPPSMQALQQPSIPSQPSAPARQSAPAQPAAPVAPPPPVIPPPVFSVPPPARDESPVYRTQSAPAPAPTPTPSATAGQQVAGRFASGVSPGGATIGGTQSPLAAAQAAQRAAPPAISSSTTQHEGGLPMLGDIGEGNPVLIPAGRDQIGQRTAPSLAQLLRPKVY